MVRSQVLSAWCITVAFSMVQGGSLHGDTIAFDSPAKWHRVLKQSVKGTLLFSDAGIEFRSPKTSHKWSYEEIRTFDLTATQELIITDYENRHWHEPGEQQFKFTLTKPIPPPVAALLADRVGRPVRNGDPESQSSSLVEIPAHRRDHFGGSNGKLRFREGGIDYLAEKARDSRTWRWSDIQTIATSDPWSFRVTGWREIVEFDLKKPLSPDLFNRLWDRLYAADLNVAPQHTGEHQ
jgi:hypothetical protein